MDKEAIKINSQPDGSRFFWRVEHLWQSARDLPPKTIKIGDIADLDQVLWFDSPTDDQPTCRAVAEHARRIYSVDLSYPIILSAEGEVWDGMHRVARAYVEGIEELEAVQFLNNPPHDGIIHENEQD